MSHQQEPVCSPCKGPAGSGSGDSGSGSGDSNPHPICKRCVRPVLPGQEGAAGPRTKEVVHAVCVNAGKKRSKMNQKNNANRAAWDAKSDEEKQEWYQKNALLDSPEKPEVTHEVVEIDELTDESRVRRVAIPYWKFALEFPGCSDAHIQNEWKKQLVSSDNKAVKFNGETLLARFEGIILDEVEKHGVAESLRKTKDCKSVQDVSAAREGARILMDKFKKQSHAWGMQFHSKTNTLSIPDNLVANQVDFADVEFALPEDLRKEVEDDMKQWAAREELLGRLLQQDMIEASFYADADAVEPTPEEIAKFRAGKKSEFQKAIDLHCQVLQEHEAHYTTLLNMAQVKLDGNEQANEPVRTLNERAVIDTRLTGWKTIVEALESKFKSSLTITDMKIVLEDLKKARIAAITSDIPLKRSASTLKTLIKRSEVGQAGQKAPKGKKRKNNGEEVPSSNSVVSSHASDEVRNLVMQNCLKEGALSLNMVEALPDGSNLDRARAQFIMCGDLKSMFTSLKWTKTLCQYLAGQMAKDSDHVTCDINKQKHVDPIKEVVHKAIDNASVFDKPTSVAYEVVGEAFGMTLTYATKDFRHSGTFPYGIGSWILVLEGELLMYSCPVEECSGTTFGDKLVSFCHLTPDEALNAVTKTGFAAKMIPGALFWVPPGNMLSISATTESSWLRWGSLAFDVKSDHQVTKAILASCALMASTFPALAIQYKDWITFLQSSLQ